MRLGAFAFATAAIIGCSSASEPGDGDDSSSPPASSPATDCGGRPEGAYKCSSSSTIMQCKAGEWHVAGSCGCSVKVGDPRKPPYAATCKVMIGVTDGVECSYAGVDCKECRPGKPCATTR